MSPRAREDCEDDRVAEPRESAPVRSFGPQRDLDERGRVEPERDDRDEDSRFRQGSAPAWDVPREVEHREYSPARVILRDVINRILGNSGGEDLSELPRDQDARVILPRPLRTDDEVVTVAIHGIMGNRGSLEHVAERLAPDTDVFQIRPEDSYCAFVEMLRNHAHSSVIRIEFTRNDDDMDRNPDQIRDFLQAVSDVHEGRTVFNMIGHSAGGVTATRALELLGPQSSVQVQSLITIDSPLSGSDTPNLPEMRELFARGLGGMWQDLRRHSAYMERLHNDLQLLPPNLVRVSVASRSDELVDMRSQTALPGAYVHIENKLSHADFSVLTRHTPVTQAVSTIDFVDRLLHNQSTPGDFAGISNGDAGYGQLNPDARYFTTMVLADLVGAARAIGEGALNVGVDLARDGGGAAIHAVRNEFAAIVKTGAAAVGAFWDAGSEFGAGVNDAGDAWHRSAYGEFALALVATPARAGVAFVGGLWDAGAALIGGQVDTIAGLYQDGKQVLSHVRDNVVEMVQDAGGALYNFVDDVAAAARCAGESVVSGVNKVASWFGW